MEVTQACLTLHDITNDSQYFEMIQKINAIYESGNFFWLLIETKDVKSIHLKYLYKFGKFLNNLKTRTPQLLCYTVIHVYDDFIFNLLYTLFTFISKPIAKVTVFYYEGGYTSTQNTEERNIKKIKYYFP